MCFYHIIWNSPLIADAIISNTPFFFFFSCQSTDKVKEEQERWRHKKPGTDMQLLQVYTETGLYQFNVSRRVHIGSDLYTATGYRSFSMRAGNFWQPG